MSQVRVLEGRKWRFALGVSIGLHVVVLAVLRSTEWPQRSSGEAVVPLEVWLSDWQPQPLPDPLEPDQETEEFEAPVPEDEPDMIADDSSPGDAVNVDETDEEAEGAPSRSINPIQRSIDWNAEARRVVVMMRKAREESESYVEFGMPFDVIAGLDSRRDQNLAESEGRLSEDGRLPERSSSGDLVLYDENGCYQILQPGSILLTDANRFFNISPLSGNRCPRPAEVRTDLFEEQKPKYLKD